MDYVYLIICNLFSLSIWNVISKPLSCIQCVTLFIIKQCVNVNIHFRGAKFLEYCYCLSLQHFNVLVTILFFPRKLLAHILTLICFSQNFSNVIMENEQSQSKWNKLMLFLAINWRKNITLQLYMEYDFNPKSISIRHIYLYVYISV